MDLFEYNLEQLCKATELDVAYIRELVSHGVIDPDTDQGHWYFRSVDVTRCLGVRRLQSELDLDTQGAALALQLVEQNKRLKRRLRYLEQLVNRLQSH